MNACMVAYTFYEGDNRVRRYAEALAARGDTVDAFVLSESPKDKFTKLRGVNVYKIQHRSVTEKNKFDYLFKLVVFLFKSCWFLTVKHFRNKYDLIHIHSIPDFEVFAAIFAKLTGAKIILDIHDIVPELFISKFRASLNSWLFKLLLLIEKLSAAFSNHVIIANHIWYEKIVDRSVKKSKCSVIMNYPDPELFNKKPTNIKKQISDDFIMIYPGTLSKHQGLDTAIQAVKFLIPEIPNLKFKIYGKGTDEEYFRNMIIKLSLEEYVEIFKPVPIDQLIDIMSEADIGVEPKYKSGFSNEAFSTKILEFMLVGIPVIVSDTKVHKYYIDDSLVKYFESENVDSLINAIKEMYHNRPLREQLVERSYKFINNNNWNVKKKLYLKLVDKVVN